MQGRVFMGRYETIRLLGEGGMGRVYLARQLDLGRQVVVKVMHDHIATDPKFRERFTRETLLMARFQHPYAVTLSDASLNDPQGPCIVMEYIRGVTLDSLLQTNGRGRRPTVTEMELHLKHGSEGRDNQLRITVVFRPPATDLATDSSWRNLCTQIFCDLRAYLMGQSGVVQTEAAE
jgi:serine/threonine protein kinase